eukprot:7499674-Pyramimonas_sp.AAC.1
MLIIPPRGFEYVHVARIVYAHYDTHAAPHHPYYIPTVRLPTPSVQTPSIRPPTWPSSVAIWAQTL